MKRTITILLSLLMMLSIVACNSSQTAPGPVAAATDVPATTAQTLEPAPEPTPDLISDTFMLSLINGKGEFETLTHDDLINICKNQARFDEYYLGKVVVIQGIVEEIKTDFYESGSTSGYSFDSIRLKDVGFKDILLLHGSNSILLDLNIGDKVLVVTNIGGTATFVDFMGTNGFGTHPNAYNKESLQKTTITIIDSFTELTKEDYEQLIKGY